MMSNNSAELVFVPVGIARAGGIADAYQRFVNHDFIGQYMKRYVDGMEARAF